MFTNNLGHVFLNFGIYLCCFYHLYLYLFPTELTNLPILEIENLSETSHLVVLVTSPDFLMKLTTSMSVDWHFEFKEKFLLYRSIFEHLY